MGISLFSHAKNSAYMLEKFEAISPDLIIFDEFIVAEIWAKSVSKLLNMFNKILGFFVENIKIS